MKHQKLPTRHSQLQQIKQAEYQRGWRDSESLFKEAEKKSAENFKRQQLQARMEALRAATALASALGQSIGELARAMASEGNQL